MGKGFDEFVKNPYWKKIYENAPSKELKEYYKIRFDMSPFVVGEEFKDDAAEKRLKKILLNKEDIQYIRDNAGSGQAKHYYDGAIKKLSGEYEGYSLPAEAFQVEVWNPWYRP